VQVGEAVRAVVALARPLAAERRVECEADGTALCARYVLADSQRLQQVLLNLVSDGIKYNRESGRVTLRCDDRPAGRLRITVTDTGVGIPPTLQPRLFTPFDRLGVEADGVEGTGLGLALSKRLVEAMGGAIGFESPAGGGSSFWVDLPETVSPDQRSGLAARALRTRPVDAERRGTILYIEDNPSNLRLLEEILSERSGVRLISAMQGRQGLDLARQHRPDLIFADLHLPDIQGDEVLHEIKRDPALQSTPVVMLSADATPEQIKRLLAAGAREYLTKPLDVAQLLTLIDATLPAGNGS
jgi:CheY-like chemotaxis protein